MAEPGDRTQRAKERQRRLSEAADNVAARLDADVLLYNGDFDPEIAPDEMLIDMCAKATLRKNMLLVLVTNGGDADTAYRVARCLQRSYESFYVLVPGWCKSAGTLVAIGAHEIIMGEHGQLGPLDVQLSKSDELFESTSGLATSQAMNFLRDRTFSQFESCLFELKLTYGNRLSTKTATEIATNLTIGLFQPIYQQIEPNRLGEITRAVSIAQEYGLRLNNVSKNLKETREFSALQKLVNGYPSHRFVIDRAETEDLFKRVRGPEQDEQALVDSLEGLIKSLSRVPNVHAPPTEPNPAPFVGLVSTGLGEGEGHGEEQDGEKDTEGEREEAESAPRRAGQDLASQPAPDGKAERTPAESPSP